MLRPWKKPHHIMILPFSEVVNDHYTYASKYSTTLKGSWALKPFMLERYLDLFTYHLEINHVWWSLHPTRSDFVKKENLNRYLLLFFRIYFWKDSINTTEKMSQKVKMQGGKLFDKYQHFLISSFNTQPSALFKRWNPESFIHERTVGLS